MNGYRLTDGEFEVFVVVHRGFETSAYAHIERSGYVYAGAYRFGGFETVGGDNDRHIRYRSHYRIVLGAVVGGARRAEAQAAVGSDDLNGKILICDVRADLLAAAKTCEDRERGSEGNKSRFRKSRRHAEKVLLRDTHVEYPLREFIAEVTDVGGLRKVGGNAYDLIVLFTELGENFAVYFF